MIGKWGRVVVERVNGEKIEKVENRELFDLIDVDRVSVLVDDEVDGDGKVGVEMWGGVGGKKGLVKGRGERYWMGEVYLGLEWEGRGIDKGWVVVEGGWV